MIKRTDGFMHGFLFIPIKYLTNAVLAHFHLVFLWTVLHRAPVVSPRKRKYEEDERQTIPNVLQGEVARLNPKFLVNLDPSHCSNNGTVHLICKLGKQRVNSERSAELDCRNLKFLASSPESCQHVTSAQSLLTKFIALLNYDILHSHFGGHLEVSVKLIDSCFALMLQFGLSVSRKSLVASNDLDS